MLHPFLLAIAEMSLLHRGVVPHAHPHGSDLVVALLGFAAAALLGIVALRRTR